MELFDFDPFVNGVCLLDIAGTEYDEFHGFAKDHAVGTVGYCFGFALVCDGESFLYDAGFHGGVEWGEAVVYVNVYSALFCQCSDFVEQGREILSGHGAHVEGCPAFWRGDVRCLFAPVYDGVEGGVRGREGMVEVFFVGLEFAVYGEHVVEKGDEFVIGVDACPRAAVRGFARGCDADFDRAFVGVYHVEQSGFANNAIAHVGFF